MKTLNSTLGHWLTALPAKTWQQEKMHWKLHHQNLVLIIIIVIITRFMNDTRHVGCGREEPGEKTRTVRIVGTKLALLSVKVEQARSEHTRYWNDEYQWQVSNRHIVQCQVCVWQPRGLRRNEFIIYRNIQSFTWWWHNIDIVTRDSLGQRHALKEQAIDYNKSNQIVKILTVINNQTWVIGIL